VLSQRDRVTEIARMLGGDPDSQISRAHANELLTEAELTDPSTGQTAGRTDASESDR
jgi:hypothetical protein